MHGQGSHLLPGSGREQVALETSHRKRIGGIIDRAADQGFGALVRQAQIGPEQKNDRLRRIEVARLEIIHRFTKPSEILTSAEQRLRFELEWRSPAVFGNQVGHQYGGGHFRPQPHA